MLKTLTVWNFALLEHVEIEFDKGLNILTGETGAGKSILIDALGAVLGNRLTTDMIRSDCDWLRVEAVFQLADEPRLREYLTDMAIDVDDDTLIITRQVSTKGRSAVLVNGSHQTVAVLKQIAEYLVDIHGQNENLTLLKPEKQLALVDGSVSDIADNREEFYQAYKQWQTTKARLAEKEAAAKDMEQRLDMLRWQTQEIENAKLLDDEDITLENEVKRLANAEKITENIEQAYSLLQGDDNSEGALAALSTVEQNLDMVSRYDDSLAEAQKLITDARCQLQEAFYSIRDYSDNLEFDPAVLDEMQSRLDLIEKLKKKYGSTVAEVKEYYEKISAELDSIENDDADKEKLTALSAEEYATAVKLADSLTVKRKEAADKLAKEICEQLRSLGMKDARFRFVIDKKTELTSTGFDDVNMYFSANVGEAEKPIDKVASGGELSRIALALKVVAAADDDSAASMVFDEIDTGIGGKTAQMVAESIAKVAAYKQVLCITHLPQIACMADVHLYLHKQAKAGKTVTEVAELSDGERVNEIARMASGIDVTAASLDNAREMLDHARLFKNRLNK